LARWNTSTMRLVMRRGVAHLALVETQHRPGCRGRGEGIGETAPTVPPRCIIVAERGEDARADVIGGRDGAREVAAGSPGERCGGERRRQGGAAKMNRADRIGASASSAWAAVALASAALTAEVTMRVPITVACGLPPRLAT
jgi:hypothetical protein